MKTEWNDEIMEIEGITYEAERFYGNLRLEMKGLSSGPGNKIARNKLQKVHFHDCKILQQNCHETTMDGIFGFHESASWSFASTKMERVCSAIMGCSAI